jgi:ADP-heptose:LPS heptosyltransferase
MLCTPYLAEAFRQVSELSQVIEYDTKLSLSRRWAILRLLRAQEYAAAFVLGPVDKVNHLAFLSGARERIGYAYQGSLWRTLTRPLFLTRSFPHPADTALRAGRPLPHEVPAMLNLLASYGVPAPKDPSLFFPVSAAAWEAARTRLQKLLPDCRQFAVLHLCSKSFGHGWTAEAFAALAERLRRLDPSTGWVVTAGPAEEPLLPPYREALSAFDIPVLTGLNLAEMAALLAQVRLLVSWDTGVVHLADAVGTPVVDIFPAQSFTYCVQRWGPWGKTAAVVEQAGEVLAESQIAAIASPVIHFIDRGVVQS